MVDVKCAWKTYYFIFFLSPKESAARGDSEQFDCISENHSTEAMSKSYLLID